MSFKKPQRIHDESIRPECGTGHAAAFGSRKRNRDARETGGVGPLAGSLRLPGALFRVGLAWRLWKG
jgi:hypothetical protein